jgi:hypothetical protein
VAVVGAVVVSLAAAGGAQATTGSDFASFTISKQTVPAGSTQAFTFEYKRLDDPGGVPGFQSSGTFTLTDGQSQTFTSGRGIFQVRELTPNGWKLTAIECDNGGDQSATDQPAIDLQAGTAQIELSPQEHKSCTFTNTAVPPPPPPVTPPPVTPPPVTPPPVTPPPVTPPVTPPGGGVLPKQVHHGAAHLQAPTRCVVSRYTVAVTGGRVASVAFFVDGKRVRTVRAHRGQRRFSVVLKPGVARSHITARVRFAANTRPRGKTLRAVVRRCAKKVVSPKFTG